MECEPPDMPLLPEKPSRDRPPPEKLRVAVPAEPAEYDPRGALPPLEKPERAGAAERVDGTETLPPLGARERVTDGARPADELEPCARETDPLREPIVPREDPLVTEERGARSLLPSERDRNDELDVPGALQDLRSVDDLAEGCRDLPLENDERDAVEERGWLPIEERVEDPLVMDGRRAV